LLLRGSPALRVTTLKLRLDAAGRDLARAVRGRLVEQRQRFELAARALHTVSPLATLDRGYAIVADATGKVLQDAASLQPGDRISARLARGHFTAAVITATPSASATQENDQ